MGDSGTLHLLPLILEDPANLKMLLDVLDRAPIPVAVAQGPDLRFVLANRAYLALSGVPPDAEMPGTARDAFPSNVTGDDGALAAKVYQAGEVRRLSAVAVKAGQGATFYDVECRPVRGSNGCVEAVLIAAFPVREKFLERHKIERAEAALREHTTRLNLALNAAEMG